MTLQIEEGVWFKTGTRNLEIKLIVLNQGSGSIEIVFKKADGSLHTERIVKGSGLGETGKFVEVTRAIPGIKFDGSLDGGGDILIRAVEGESVLHLLEIKPTSAACVLKSQGDADCNGVINLIDFGIWKNEFLKAIAGGNPPAGGWKSDFDGDGAVNIADYGNWKANYLIVCCSP